MITDQNLTHWTSRPFQETKSYPLNIIPGLGASPDMYPKIASVYDEEFDSATLDAKWTVAAGGASIYDVNTTWPSYIYCVPDKSLNYYVDLDQNITTTSTYSMTAKFVTSIGAADHCMLYLYQSGTWYHMTRWSVGTSGNNSSVVYSHRKGGAADDTIAVDLYKKPNQLYLHIQKDSAVNDYYSSWFSFNGMSWIRSDYFNMTNAFAPTYIRLRMGNSSAGAKATNTYCGCDWFRFNWTFMN